MDTSLLQVLNRKLPGNTAAETLLRLLASLFPAVITVTGSEYRRWIDMYFPGEQGEESIGRAIEEAQRLLMETELQLELVVCRQTQLPSFLQIRERVNHLTGPESDQIQGAYPDQRRIILNALWLALAGERAAAGALDLIASDKTLAVATQAIVAEGRVRRLLQELDTLAAAVRKFCAQISVEQVARPARTDRSCAP